jgi:hypothetical protein
MKPALNTSFVLFLVVVSSVLVALDPAGSPARAEGFSEQFTDSTDGAFDMSRWLDSAYGFMPIVSIITEPAVGFGVSGGVVFIQRPREDVGKPLTTPPSMYGAMGFYTENKTWGTGAFYKGHWRKDRIRYLGFGGYMSVNLTYYPPILSDRGIGFDFNIEGGGIIQRLEFRLRETNWFLGAEYSFFKNTVTFNLPDIVPGFDEYKIDFRIGGLGPLVNYDSRDYTFTTNRGIYGHTQTMFHAPVFGGDEVFITGVVYGLGWLPVNPVVCGLRLDYRYSDGSTPFYSQPFVKLRGIPAMRYQDKYTAVIETEERWNIAQRWAINGFAGIGKAFGDNTTFSDAELVWGVGGGFRYKLARVYNLFGGIDVARGPEQWAVYIVVGQWWNTL